MAGFGRKKRSSSSSSSSFPTYCMTAVVFVAFCGLGAWMLTSSPIIPSHITEAMGVSTSSSSSGRSGDSSSSGRFRVDAYRDSPPAMEDTQGDLPEEAIKGDSVNESGEGGSDESKSDDRGGSGSGGGGGGSKESEQQEQAGEEEGQRDRNGEDEEKKEEGEKNQQQQQLKTEEQIEHDGQLPEQEQQQPQQSQNASDEGQPEIDENQDQIDNKIQEVTKENEDQSEQNSENEQSERQMVDGSHTEKSSEEQQSENEKKNNEVSKASNDEAKTARDSQTQHSDNKERRRKGEALKSISNVGSSEETGHLVVPEWKLCNVTSGPDYIPCLDNEKAIKKLHSMSHYEHRERHCPEESPTCLVPLPTGYRRSTEWPKSRDRIWYKNVPHAKLAEVKGHQNWVKVSGEYLTFPGGGTQFIHGALSYIDFLQRSVPEIAWGRHTRVILDVGCGVASFGGYIFERDVLTLSFAPKDEHEAQVQFALERGIPAFSAVMGTQRLPFPSNVFDIVHCARCRVPWHADGGTLLLELNRVLRPGGFFVWSATPVYQKLPEDVEIWNAMKILTKSMCWSLVTIQRDKLNSIGAAFYRKPISNECYNSRKHHSPPMCKEDDDRNAAWYIPLKACMHPVPVDASDRGKRWPKDWPNRLSVPPYWLNRSQMGVYGKPAPDDFTADYKHWKQVREKSYLSGLGISWSKVRNVMDMRAVYGGFAAALKEMSVWVMNVVNINDPDTLPIIYDRGLFGMYHDWCESFSTYPRTYDLLHADHLFSSIEKRCSIVPVIAEVDRIVKPGGKLIVRDDSATISKVESLIKSLHWDIRLTFSKDQNGILCAEKSDWRPQEYLASS